MSVLTAECVQSGTTISEGGDIGENQHSRYGFAQREGSPGGCHCNGKHGKRKPDAGEWRQQHHHFRQQRFFRLWRFVFTLFDVITNVTGDPVTGAFTPGAGANNFLYYGRIRTSDRKESAAVEDSAPAQSRAFATGTVAVQKARLARAC